MIRISRVCVLIVALVLAVVGSGCSGSDQKKGKDSWRVEKGHHKKSSSSKRERDKADKASTEKHAKHEHPHHHPHELSDHHHHAHPHPHLPGPGGAHHP